MLVTRGSFAAPMNTKYGGGSMSFNTRWGRVLNAALLLSMLVMSVAGSAGARWH
jgi:hypothetical protein